MALAHQRHTLKRGPLSEAEVAEIDRLGGRGWTSGRIALKLNRNPATVGWRLIRLGHRAPMRRSTPYWRGGILVTPFCEAEDARLQALALQGLGSREIARRLTEEFGHRRTKHGVYVRLVMLASAEACAEAAA